MGIGATSARMRIPGMWFETYLRTGATPWESAANDVERKANGWHDPHTGRFTSAGQGVWYGGGFTGGGGASGTWEGGGFTGGGGGSLGGGGAFGSWGSPSSSSPNSPQKLRPNPSVDASTTQAASAKAKSQDRVVVRNGYAYRLDATGRTTAVTGNLTLTSDPQRSRSVQSNAGGSDRLPTDDGGHYIAARFNGPTDTFNHFMQTSTAVAIARWKTSGPRISRPANKSMSRSRLRTSVPRNARSR